MQSIRAPGTKVPLAEGQRALGARQPLPTDGDGAADREHAALGLGQLRLRGVEQLRHRRGHRPPPRQTYVLGWWHPEGRAWSRPCLWGVG